MTNKLEGQVALVSGSGRGIGREIALKLAREGARVVINDLDAAPAEQTVADIRAAGGQAVACVGSVTEAGFAERFVDTALSTYGDLHIVVNNAGYTWDNVIQKMSDEQWYAIMDCHLTAPFRILRAAQPVIRARSPSRSFMLMPGMLAGHPKGDSIGEDAAGCGAEHQFPGRVRGRISAKP